MADEIADDEAGIDVEAERRLVQEDEVGVGDEAPDDVHLLPLSGGDRPHLGVGLVDQAEHFKSSSMRCFATSLGMP